MTLGYILYSLFLDNQYCNNLHFYEVLCSLGMTEKESSTSYYKKENSNNKEAFTDESKSTGWKLNFAVVIADITRRRAQSEDVSTHTV